METQMSGEKKIKYHFVDLRISDKSRQKKIAARISKLQIVEGDQIPRLTDASWTGNSIVEVTGFPA